MRISRGVPALVLIAAMPLAAFAGPAKSQPDSGKSRAVTVGDFAVMLAAATGSARSLEAGKAVESLARSGVPVGDPRQILSEGKLVEILDYYGVKARTAAPGQAVSLGKAETALLAAGSSLGAAAAATSSAPDADIDVCLGERNHGQCTVCCKAFPGTTATGCSHFCHQLNRKSPSEPLP